VEEMLAGPGKKICKFGNFSLTFRKIGHIFQDAKKKERQIKKKPIFKGDKPVTYSEFNKLCDLRLDAIKPGEVHTFEYKEHLSENRELIERLTGLALSGKKEVQLVAPCGAGKTYTTCIDMAKALRDKKQIVLLTPNSIQSEQNEVSFSGIVDGEEYKCLAITGKKCNAARKNNRTVYSVVYDSIERLEDLEDYTDVVLFVDEAHQLFDAREYRAKALGRVESVILQVLSCGGTVVYVTGTPNKISGRKFDEKIICTHVDSEGKSLPDIMGESLYIFRNTSQKTVMRDFSYSGMTALLQSGKRLLVRLNDKSDIERLAIRLRADGHKVLTLSSEDKGMHDELCDEVDEDGYISQYRKTVYDSEMYRKIMEEETLPYADVYLVTSILEVGTSVKYVENVLGEKEQPKNIIPMFIVRNHKEVDLDNIMQFFARLRFPYHSACVMMNIANVKTTEDKVSITSQERIMRAMFARAYRELEAFKIAGAGRFCLPTIEGYDEGEFSFLQNGELDFEALVGASYTQYYRQALTKPDETKNMLAAFFGMDAANIDIRNIDGAKKYAVENITSIPDGTKKVLDDILYDVSTDFRAGKLLEAISAESGIDHTNEYVQRIENCDAEDGEFGRKILKTMRSLNAACGVTDSYELLSFAVQKVENGKTLVVNKRGTIVDLKQLAKDKFFDFVVRFKAPEKRIQIQDFYENYLRPYANNRKARMRKMESEDVVMAIAKRAGINADMYKFFLANIDKVWLTCFFETFVGRRVLLKKWNEIAGLMRVFGDRKCQEIKTMAVYAYMNEIDINSEKEYYDAVVQPLRLQSGVEYDVLRNLDKIPPYIPGQMPKDCPDCGNIEFNFEKANYPTVGFEQAKYIAWYLSGQVKEILGIKKNYKPGNILERIKLMYSVKASHNSFKDKDGNYRFVLRGLRTTGTRMHFGTRETDYEILESINEVLLTRQQLTPADLDNIESRLKRHHSSELARWVRNKIAPACLPAEDKMHEEYKDCMLHAMITTAEEQGLAIPYGLRDMAENGEFAKFMAEHQEKLYPLLPNCDFVTDEVLDLLDIDGDEVSGETAVEIVPSVTVA